MFLHTGASLLLDVGGTENFNRTSSRSLMHDVSQVIVRCLSMKDGVISKRQVEAVAFVLARGTSREKHRSILCWLTRTSHDCSALSSRLSAATCKGQRLTGKLASPPSALVQMLTLRIEI